MKKPRQITVDGKRYLWRFRPRYRETGNALNPYECEDVFSAWLQGHPRAPLRMVCVTWEHPISGGPLRTGAPLDLADEASPRVNLYEPRWAAAVIRAAGRAGWNPESLNKPFIVTDWHGLLENAWAAEQGASAG